MQNAEAPRSVPSEMLEEIGSDLITFGMALSTQTLESETQPTIAVPALHFRV